MGRRPIDDPRRHAWALFLGLHATLLERIEAVFAQAQLPPLAWYDVLWELEKAAGGRLRMNELAAAVVISRSNITRLADRLEEAGLLRRDAVPGDRRGYYCVLSEAGKEMRRKMWPVYRQAIDAHFGAHLSEKEANTLSEVFARVLKAARTSAV